MIAIQQSAITGHAMDASPDQLEIVAVTFAYIGLAAFCLTPVEFVAGIALAIFLPSVRHTAVVTTALATLPWLLLLAMFAVLDHISPAAPLTWGQFFDHFGVVLGVVAVFGLAIGVISLLALGISSMLLIRATKTLRVNRRAIARRIKAARLRESLTAAG